MRVAFPIPPGLLLLSLLHGGGCGDDDGAAGDADGDTDADGDADGDGDPEQWYFIHEVHENFVE